MKSVIVAIDGPSGAGKGTVARAVASALGFKHVDTGAMYRALAWKAVRQGVSLDDGESLARVGEEATFALEGSRISIDGQDVSSAIRTSEIDAAAAAVARHPAVRRVLVARQRALGRFGGVVMEGRDIGTVVFPDADVKIYLDAAPEERARRRATDPAHSGSTNRELDAVATELAERDRSDSTRSASPLAVAPDAHVIDTTGLDVEEVVERVLRVVGQG
jgi:cytidylate kinase